MEIDIWKSHLQHWEQYLDQQIECAAQKEDFGAQKKAQRQLQTLRNVEYAAVLNPGLIAEFIDPIIDADPFIPDSFFLPLNSSQKCAVCMALGDGYMNLIQGPPGTGKTQVIAEICLQLHKRNPNIRILVCSETHVAVNNLIARIAERVAKLDINMRMVRIQDREMDQTIDEFSTESILTGYRKWLDQFCIDGDVKNALFDVFCSADDRSLEKALALSSNVVGMTCNRVAAYSFQTSLEMFDVAIVDEVCKATLPEILIPLCVSYKAILVGDPKQLPPVFCSDDREIIRQLRTYDLLHHMHIDQLYKSAKNVSVLNTQYRMTKQIGAMISDVFYAGCLEDGRNMDSPDSLLWVDYKPSKVWPEEGALETEIYNLDECALIASIIKSFGSSLESKKIAVIAPYRAQVRELRKVLSSNVSVNTVDAFQGKESDVVIFSLTRTHGSLEANLFLADNRRLNVALSRAKDKLIIVGNKEYAAKNALLRAIMGKCILSCASQYASVT